MSEFTQVEQSKLRKIKRERLLAMSDAKALRAILQSLVNATVGLVVDDCPDCVRLKSALRHASEAGIRPEDK